MNLNTNTANNAPKNGAVQYIHRCSQQTLLPDTIAGAMERAGFIDAPQMGPANMASNPTTEATAIPAVITFSFAPLDTCRITNMRQKVSISARIKDRISLPVGMVAPRF